jgi:hypothetical protein
MLDERLFSNHSAKRNRLIVIKTDSVLRFAFWISTVERHQSIREDRQIVKASRSDSVSFAATSIWIYQISLILSDEHLTINDHWNRPSH